MKQLLLGALVAAIALFVWGFLYWGLNPLPYSAWSESTDDAALGQVLKQHLPESGTYYIPGPHLASEARDPLHTAGPLAFIFFVREGKPVLDSSLMFNGFVLNLVFAVLFGLVIKLALPAIPSYADGVKFCFMTGLAAAVFIDLGDAVWWRMAWSWKFWTFFYSLSAFVVSGLVLLKFLQPNTPAASEPRT